MNATAIAEQNAVEAIKSSYRQTKDGVSVTFVIHPQEMPDALALAPLGSRWMVALVQVGDDEQPIREQAAQSGRPDTSPAPIAPRSPGAAGKPDGAGPALPKVKRKWEDMAIVTRAGMMCSDERAWPVFDRFHDKAPILCEREAEIFLRAYCGVMSRTQIDDNPDARHNFLGIETEYLRATRP